MYACMRACVYLHNERAAVQVVVSVCIYIIVRVYGCMGVGVCEFTSVWVYVYMYIISPLLFKCVCGCVCGH